MKENYYRELSRNYGDKNHLMSLKIKKVAELLPEEGRCLDIGCGTGALLEEIENNIPGLESYGVDAEREAIDFIADKSKTLKEKICLYNGIYLPFNSDAFNCACCLDVLEHVDDPGRLLKEIHRVLKPKASLIITVPNWFDIIAVKLLHRSPGHLQTGTPFGWKRRIESSGFNVDFFHSVRFPIINAELFNRSIPLFGMCIMLHARCLK